MGATTNLLNSDLTGTVSGTDSTSLFTSPIGAGEWLALHIVSVSGSPTQLAVTLNVT